MEKINNIFNKLNAINVSELVSKKKSGSQDLTYLPWADCLEIAYSNYLDSEVSWIVYENPQYDNLPIWGNASLGYFTKTQVTIQGISKNMFLPVMDGNNNYLTNEPYEYTTKFGTKKVGTIDVFEINKSVLRCLVKNFALFGIGLYVYKGEDLPTDEKEKIIAEKQNAIANKQKTELQEIDKIRCKIIELVANYAFENTIVEYVNIKILNVEAPDLKICTDVLTKLNALVNDKKVSIK
jgi:hypothetical protein